MQANILGEANDDSFDSLRKRRNDHVQYRNENLQWIADLKQYTHSAITMLGKEMTNAGVKIEEPAAKSVTLRVHSVQAAPRFFTIQSSLIPEAVYGDGTKSSIRTENSSPADAYWKLRVNERRSDMKKATRNIATIMALFLLGACVSVGRIQQTEPVRTTKFTGSAKAVAQCIQARLGAKLQPEGFGERYILFNSVKSMAAQGLTHYAITVARTGPDQGIMEWRIQRPTETGGPMSATGGTLAPSAVGLIWGPAEECAAKAKSLQ